MTDPRNINTSEFTYDLPERKIAQFPLQERDQSKLLVFQHNRLEEDIYANIARHISAGSLLVFNNSKVIHARLLFRKPSGGMIETFLLEPATPHGYRQLAEPDMGTADWKCLIGGASKWKQGQVPEKIIETETGSITLSATIIDRNQDFFVIRFTWSPPARSIARILELAGSVPIPPYLKRTASAQDDDRYQTIYASQEGSVAAPTAGLHFTEGIFESFREKRIRTATITLHVGAGTFLPVKAPTLAGHSMHAEWIQADQNFLAALISQQEPVVAVGTTSLRTLESLYWMGVKCHRNPAASPEELEVGQWDPYESGELMPRNTALEALAGWMKRNGSETLSIKTRLLIAPPYRPRVAGALVTNFHQPGSTLLLLVAAVTGNRWKLLYDHALANDFRFLSYGDGCLIFF